MGNVNGGKVGSLEYGMLNTCKFSLVEKGRMHCKNRVEIGRAR